SYERLQLFYSARFLTSSQTWVRIKLVKRVTPPTENIKSVLTLGTLLIAYPLGLLLMWKWTNWPLPVKLSIALLPLTLLLLLLFGAVKLGTIIG
ncbi:hypothetical protein C4544_03500, partial [candidate division WS5 bacterium]